MNDKISFLDSRMSPLRSALIDLYGFEKSPITEVLEQFIAKTHTDFEKANGRITISGTDGWKWHIDYSDPEVNGFSISSSIKGGPERLIVEDTTHDGYWWGGLEDVLDQVSPWPRALNLVGSTFLVIQKDL